MGRKKQNKEKTAKKAIVRGKRSDKVIVDQFTRKFRRIIKSQGITAARDWLAKDAKRSIGKGKDTQRLIYLPIDKLQAILVESSA